MERKEFEKIIEDYDFACIVAKRYKNETLSSLYELFDELEYRTYNFSKNELFDMEIGNLFLTYSAKLGGIDKAIQVWYDEEWYDTDIEDFKSDLGVAMLSHTIYKNRFYKDHDRTDEPVCFDEFYNNEWQDEEIKQEYLKEIKGEQWKMKVFLLKDLCEDCVDAVIISKNDNITAKEIQENIDKMKQEKKYDWQWEDIEESLPENCEIYRRWQDLEETITY